MPTPQEIQIAIGKLIDYKELARLLQSDLNSIANEVLSQTIDVEGTPTPKFPNQYIDFEVFFDVGEFNTYVTAQAPGEGRGFYKTPVLLTAIGGQYSTERGPQVFSLEFRIEAFGFDKDYELTREILTVYSQMNQGKIRNLNGDEFAGTMQVVSFSDFPALTTPTQYKGFNRFSGFISLFMTFIYTGQLANAVNIILDGDEIKPLSFTVSRQRIGDSAHITGTAETVTINKSQVLSFACSLIYDGSDIHNKILANIRKSLTTNLNETFDLEIIYPETGDDLDEYSVIITDGRIDIQQGGYLSMVFTMNIAGV
jgi:hypothetical protein